MEKVGETATGTRRHALQLFRENAGMTHVNALLQDHEFPDTRVKIAGLIRRERHSDVYSVYIDEDGSSLDQRAEARAFILNGVPAELRRHRTRCMRRLRHRALLEAPFRGAMVTVYETIQSEKEDQVMEMTEHNEQAKRVRQREKRRVNRKQKAESKTLEDAPESAQLLDENKPVYAPELSDRETHLSAAVMLRPCYDDQGKNRLGDIGPKLRLLHEIRSRSPKLEEFWKLLAITRGKTRWLQPTVEPITGVEIMCDLMDNHIAMQRFVEQIHKHLSEMSYHQLSSGICIILSNVSNQEQHATSRNGRLETLRYIQSGLIVLLRKMQAVYKLMKDKFWK
ncbi:hypothetical protein FVEN_g11828 [Fusarium venenatum]|uniref:Uncharacterized protein n=1 Tax=Fusarium venenatum TaxID=56646 RepID=A0A2L2TDQ4_9HYPO|nr:uncharacterized protein FVRRES_08295 [Fusarium venenatum]KAG8349979.1 hypothetical protein FVEN_g11828 [Fusarium venenatum]KAH6965083.1 hypothetical protein EDB82DRAFT_288994 [Fusarium venenatum]CEI68218.1 unnamed protein product [Fusarium venenatum]